MSDRGDLMTVEEMIARAELEPTLRDFYVEGHTDVPVYAAFFDHLGLDVAVFAISDRVDIRRENVEPYTNDYGERAKLIAAAAITERLSALAAQRLTFVVDSDWAHVVGPVPIDRACLEMTDLPSLEHYFFDSPSFAYALAAGLGHDELDVETVRAEVRPILRDLAAARLPLEMLNIACIEKVSNLIQTTSKPASANSAEIVKRSLGRLGASRPQNWQSYVEMTTHYRELIEEARHDGRGHDIAIVLIAYLRLRGHLADEGVVEAIMRSSTTVQTLSGYPFFQRLADRARAA